ncbi:Lcl domain-containing protein [Parabacteroides sp.]
MLKELSTSILTILLLSIAGCQDDLPENTGGTEGKETITLTFIAEPGPVAKTKAEVRPSTPGGKAEKAGFSYEMVVTAIDSTGPATKAKPASFKNATALLFTSAGAFNGRATIGTFQGGVPLTATFTGVTATNATNCRLVLVADDAATTVNLANNDKLKSYSDTYSTFISASGPSINQEGKITQDADIPYVGSITGVNISSSDVPINTISLYRMLGKVMVSTPGLNAPGAIPDGIWLYNAQNRYCLFGTPNNYDGSGSEEIEQSKSEFFQKKDWDIDGTVTFYGGEMIKKYTVSSFEERNCFTVTTDAVYLAFQLKYNRNKTNISIGKEYHSSSSINFYVYLGNGEVSDFSFRRNHVYDITVNISGTEEDFMARSIIDRRITTGSNTDPYANRGGLCVGRFGGFVPINGGTNFSDVKGYYTKMLLLEPNNSREPGATDKNTYVWNASQNAPVQTDARRYWDYSYIKSLSGGLGGMSNVDGSAFYYCNNLTFGGVAKGTWYVPTAQQLSAIQIVLAGMRENPVYDYYSAISNDIYWASTEYSTSNAWVVDITYGSVTDRGKTTPFRMRCVRDL